MIIDAHNSPQSIFDKHFPLKCPHCGTFSNLTAISIPRYEYLARFRPQQVGVFYRCDSCNSPIPLKFRVGYSRISSGYIDLSEEYQEIEKAKESFEYKYLPPEVKNDFEEALICYSNNCYNAFGAMCRRCIQSALTELGVKGTDKVVNQLKELKETAELDDETFKILEQIIISGHDGAHPHLPKLSPDRAIILFELMKDVLYQLFVRKSKIQETMELRKKKIQEDKK